jgi:hypothetical protein
MNGGRNVAVRSAARRASRRLETALLMTTLLIMSATAASARVIEAPATGGTCGPKDAQSDRLVAYFKNFVGKTDMGGKVEKSTFGLTTVTPSQVVLVTDNAICAKAATAFVEKQLEKHSSYTLYVVTLGSSYAVEEAKKFNEYGIEDKKMTKAGWETSDVFDSNWNFVGGRQIHGNH